MRIEEVEELDKGWREDWTKETEQFTIDLLEALRDEAWYPIERAGEMGVLNEEIPVLGYGDWGGVIEWFPMIWEGKFWTTSGDFVNPTHFKRIASPGN